MIYMINKNIININFYLCKMFYYLKLYYYYIYIYIKKYHLIHINSCYYPLIMKIFHFIRYFFSHFLLAFYLIILLILFIGIFGIFFFGIFLVIFFIDFVFFNLDLFELYINIKNINYILIK